MAVRTKAGRMDWARELKNPKLLKVKCVEFKKLHTIFFFLRWRDYVCMILWLLTHPFSIPEMKM
jgi:hypothetical protein